jgi:hypothetical protein
MGNPRAGIPRGNRTTERHSVGVAECSEDHACQTRANARHLYVAFSDPVDHAVLRAIEQMTGWSASPCIVSDTVMDRLLSKMHSSERDYAHTFENVIEPAEIARITASYAGRLGTSEVKLTECGAYIWARLKDGRRDSDILFRVSPKSRGQGQSLIAEEAVPQQFR